MTRRELLGGAIASIIEGPEGLRRRVSVGQPTYTRYRDGEFPVIWLVLAEKRDLMGDPKPWSGVRRLVSVDLEDEDEWGDINSVCVGETLRLGLGDDENGYWMIERAFVMIEPTLDLHEGKYPVSYEISLDCLGKIIEARVNSWLGCSI